MANFICALNCFTSVVVNYGISQSKPERARFTWSEPDSPRESNWQIKIICLVKKTVCTDFFIICPCVIKKVYTWPDNFPSVCVSNAMWKRGCVISFRFRRHYDISPLWYFLSFYLHMTQFHVKKSCIIKTSPSKEKKHFVPAPTQQ